MNKENIYLAQTENDFEQGKFLFLEYSKKLDFNLCFQNFEEELKDIHTQYNKPNGALVLLREGSNFIGCVGIRKFENRIAELKRMYVQEKYRGFGYGKLLLNQAISEARNLQYERIRLDTLKTMKEAISLYKKLGFINIEPYRENPINGTEYLELILRRNEN